VANLVSGIVVFGLCIDFGIHILHAWLHRSHRTTRRAVSLAAGTTCVGAGVLLFARHPVLFSAGLTLTVGVGAGYVAAVLVVPALCELFLQKRREEVSP
jgi:predicted RND superfamily exporter protein